MSAEDAAEAERERALSSGRAGSRDPWTGFYLGLNGGYGGQSTNQNFGLDGGGGANLFPFFAGFTGSNFNLSGNGVFYGAHAGYDHRWSDIVGGAELSVMLSNATATAMNPNSGAATPITYSSSVRWLATLAPRAGWAFDNFLVYGKAGLAIASMSHKIYSGSIPACFTVNATEGCTFQDQKIHVGFVLGVGIEYLVAENWSIGVEANYIDLSRELYGGLSKPATALPIATDLQPRFTFAKARASYRF
jgi:outer membrane immunogenic protein